MWWDLSDATKVIKLQLWGSRYLSDPSQDGGCAGPAGHRGHDGAAHLPGRDLPQVNTQSLSDQADLMNALEISRDIDNRFFEVFRILVM